MTEKQFKPQVYKLPKTKDGLEFLKKYKSDIHITSSYAQPLFSLGFHSFQHRTKSAMNITRNLETKNKFYNIVNDFDPDNIKIKNTFIIGIL